MKSASLTACASLASKERSRAYDFAIAALVFVFGHSGTV